MRRKQERALRRIRKTAKKNLRLALETEGDCYAMESQTEASEVENTMTRLIHIGNTKGFTTSATELSGARKTGQAAKDAMTRR